MAQYNLYRGNREKYSSETHKDGIFFALDTHEILVNDQSYSGLVLENLEQIVIAEDKLTFKYNGGTPEVEVTADNTFLLNKLKGQEVKAGNGIEVSPSADGTTVTVKVKEGGHLSAVEEGLEVLTSEVSTGGDNLATAADVKAYVDAEVGKIGVNPDDKILSFAEGKVSSEFGIEYVKAEKKIKVTGKGGTSLGEIDTTDFVKDGMLDSVTLEGTSLKLTFNTDAGKEAVTVDLAAFAYTAGDGLSLDETVFSVKGKGHISVTADGVDVTTGSVSAGEEHPALASDVKTYVDDIFGWEEPDKDE